MVDVLLNKRPSGQWLKTPWLSWDETIIYRSDHLPIFLKAVRHTLAYSWKRKAISIGPLSVQFLMMTSSNGNISRVTDSSCGVFTDHRWIPLTKPVTRSFDVFFDLQLNKRLSKQSRRRWLDTPSCSSLRHYKPAHHSMPVLTIPWPCLHMRYGPFQFGSESNLCGELMLGTIVDEDEVGVVTVNGADIHGLRVLHPVLSRPATL